MLPTPKSFLVWRAFILLECLEFVGRPIIVNSPVGKSPPRDNRTPAGGSVLSLGHGTKGV